jgi:hypothetical protein
LYVRRESRYFYIQTYETDHELKSDQAGACELQLASPRLQTLTKTAENTHLLNITKPSGMDARSSVYDGGSVAGSESSKMKLQLPASCDPPQPGAPVKPLVWIASHLSATPSSFLKRES